MKFLLSILMFSLLVVGGIADAHASPPGEEFGYTIRTTPHLEMNEDSMGLAIHPDGVGLVSQGHANIVLYKIPESGQVIAVIGNLEDDTDLPKGLVVSGDGDTLFVTSNTVVITRQTFDSHAEADAALVDGEEYYLSGDRSVYRKP